MPKKSKESTEAQLRAQKHNGNCRRLSGSIENLRAIMEDCHEGISKADKNWVNAQLDTTKILLREGIETEFNIDCSKK